MSFIAKKMEDGEKKGKLSYYHQIKFFKKCRFSMGY